MAVFPPENSYFDNEDMTDSEYEELGDEENIEKDVEDVSKPQKPSIRDEETIEKQSEKAPKTQLIKDEEKTEKQVEKAPKPQKQVLRVEEKVEKLVEKPQKPLSGLTVVVSHKLRDYRYELKEICERLGANFSWNFDQKTTHLIYEEESSLAVDDDFITAQALGKFVVSRRWLYACRDLNERVEESKFSYVTNPWMADDFTELYYIFQ
ncbi:hypothetical protein CHUAL_005996 [Chamberlinius hualienensis]